MASTEDEYFLRTEAHRVIFLACDEEMSTQH